MPPRAWPLRGCPTALIAQDASQGWEQAVKKVLGDAKPIEGKLVIDLPEIAENGNTVPFTISVDSPMSEADNVKVIHVLATANPQPGVAVFRFSPLSGKATVASRMRLARTQDVIGIAELSDGRFLISQAQRQGDDRRVRRLGGSTGMAKARIKLPDSAKVGDVIEVKTLISHVMETGQRKDADGKTIPRSIINSFKATFAGADVFTAELHPGMSANPYLSFFMKVPGPGEFEFTWIDDAGVKVVEKMKLNVA